MVEGILTLPPIMWLTRSSCPAAVRNRLCPWLCHMQACGDTEGDKPRGIGIMIFAHVIGVAIGSMIMGVLTIASEDVPPNDFCGTIFNSDKTVSWIVVRITVMSHAVLATKTRLSRCGRVRGGVLQHVTSRKYT